MAERVSATNITQLGPETIAGTTVPTTKLLASLEITPTPKTQNKLFRPAGRKFNSFLVPGREWLEAKLSGQATYGEIVYPLCGVLRNVTPTTDGTLPKLWDHVPALSLEDPIKTFTIEQGNAVRAHRWSYGLITDYTLKFTREGVEQSGNMIGQALVDGIALTSNAKYTLTTDGSAVTAGDFTLTVGAATTADIAYNATPAQVQSALEALVTVGTGNVLVTLASGGPNLDTAGTVYTVEFVNGKGTQAVAMTGTFTGLTPSGGVSSAQTQTGVTSVETTPVPIAGDDISIYLDNSWATLGNTLATRVLSAEWSITGRYGQLWVLDGSQTSFVAHIEKPPKVQLKLQMEADAVGMGLLTNMRAGTNKWVRIACVGPQIEAGKNYMLQLDGCYAVDQPSELKDQDGVIAIEWTMEATYDPTALKTIEALVRNQIATL